MNEILKAIAQRFSCRDFDETALTDAQIKAITDAALAAPSARNIQPWHITIITDKKLIDELDAEGMNVLSAAEDKSVYERVRARGGKLFYNSPCAIVVSSDGSNYADIDSGILSQNVTLAAHSLGLGSVICGMMEIPLSGPYGNEYKKRMQFPDGYDFVIAILIGGVKTAKEPHKLDTGKLTFVK
ncbi:MAG: nitroreductase family protein [Oscillospiraceae bacterium]|jgi:nitroreductase|nr:nitroreductase family protein [Oscillospiraceae bacterium]